MNVTTQSSTESRKLGISQTNKWRGRAIRGFLILLVIWIAMVLWMIWSAYGHSNKGREHLVEAQRQLSVDAITSGKTRTSLRPAAREFRIAHGRLSNPIMMPAKLIPVVGRQLKSLTAMSGVASDISSFGVEAAERAGVVLKKGAGTRHGRIALVESIADIAREADTKLARVDLGPSEALFPPLLSARREAESELGEARAVLGRVIAACDGLSQFLTGPSKYLVMASNNSEMRAGSGMFLSLGLLDVADGALNIGEFGDVPDFLPAGSVPIQGDFADRWGWTEPNREWRNLGMSPQFDVTGELAARMWKVARGDQVDGVLALDVVALKALLRATGPIVVDGQTISESDVEAEVLHDQYLGIGGNVAGRVVRRDRMGRIASAAVRMLDLGQWDPGKLADEIARAARGRHILAWSSRRAEQRAWMASGVDGRLEKDSLMVSVLNRGGNKLDQFLTVSADMEAAPRAGTTHVNIRLKLLNSVTEGEPQYILGLNPPLGAGAGLYRGIVAVNLPGSARSPRIGGNEKLVASGPDGPTIVYATEVTLRPGETVDLLVEFDLPKEQEGLRIHPSARIPAITWKFGSERWTDVELRRLSLSQRD